MNVKKMKHLLVAVMFVVILPVLPILAIASDFELDTGDHEVEIIQHIPPTAHEEGSLTVRCVDCGQLFVFTLYATGCVWGAWVIEREPTCTQTGLRRVTCNVEVPHSHTEVIPATGHRFVREETPPSCTEEGQVMYTCSVCHYTRPGEPLEALGHDLIRTVTLSPSCLEAGEVTVTCGRCDYTRIEPDLEVRGHEFTENIIEATCLEAGQRQLVCDHCDYSITETIELLPHEWGQWQVMQYPEEGIEGLRYRECMLCGARIEEEIEALPVVPEVPEERGFFGVEEAVVVGANFLALGIFAFLLLSEFILLMWRRKRKKEIKERIAMERGFDDGYQSI